MHVVEFQISIYSGHGTSLSICDSWQIAKFGGSIVNDRVAFQVEVKLQFVNSERQG